MALRHQKCGLLVKHVLDSNHKGVTYWYNRSNKLYTKKRLNQEFLCFEYCAEELPKEIRELVGHCTVNIRITPCEECRIDIGDLITKTSQEFLKEDHSLREFFEILSNHDALQSKNYYAFGSGRLFPVKPPEDTPPPVPKELEKWKIGCVDKGARVIGGNAGVSAPAFVIDEKAGIFYRDVKLVDLYKRFKENSNLMSASIKGMTLQFCGC
ncbi:unnamed protein product [Gongylonema pulchrum]|uniref:Uncharacterized protein n=1 Tax=Gongylonema pulchrum TaxID=637853 RepID=A0A183EHB7_9BILA|nr:unnamed protein product [Gongylonema pulchrum]